jgi:hypothetical protein
MDEIAEAMKEAFEKHGLKSRAICAKPGSGGRIIKQ